jgi:hypothetical protein
MAIRPRTVRNKRDANGVSAGRSGTVYGVNIKYNSPEGKKSYAKRGFSTKREAAQHEAEMKVKLANPTHSIAPNARGKMSVADYMSEWLDIYEKLVCAQALLKATRALSRVTPSNGGGRGIRLALGFAQRLRSPVLIHKRATGTFISHNAVNTQETWLE